MAVTVGIPTAYIVGGLNADSFSVLQIFLLVLGVEAASLLVAYLAFRLSDKK